jgi:hypothetical protein
MNQSIPPPPPIAVSVVPSDVQLSLFVCPKERHMNSQYRELYKRIKDDVTSRGAGCAVIEKGIVMGDYMWVLKGSEGGGGVEDADAFGYNEQVGKICRLVVTSKAARGRKQSAAKDSSSSREEEGGSKWLAGLVIERKSLADIITGSATASGVSAITGSKKSASVLQARDGESDCDADANDVDGGAGGLESFGDARHFRQERNLRFSGLPATAMLIEGRLTKCVHLQPLTRSSDPEKDLKHADVIDSPESLLRYMCACICRNVPPLHRVFVLHTEQFCHTSLLLAAFTAVLNDLQQSGHLLGTDSHSRSHSYNDSRGSVAVSSPTPTNSASVANSQASRLLLPSISSNISDTSRSLPLLSSFNSHWHHSAYTKRQRQLIAKLTSAGVRCFTAHSLAQL